LAIDGARIRSTLLQVVADLAARYPDGGLQSIGVLSETASKLAGGGRRLSPDQDQALLIAFYDLFRTGHLCWGFNLANPNPPFFHITEQGRRTLEHLSRDPSNPDGYIAHLERQASLNPIARSYVDEALLTYNTNCFRAAAVMIGAAVESLILQLRDTVVAGVRKSGREPAKDLSHQLVKRVIDAVHKQLEMQQAAMSFELREQFEAYWPAFTQQIRAARNDAGHPASIAPITPEMVHSALLIFPELAGVWAKLLTFAAEHYKVSR
jgi:hypothetical protein